MERQTVDFGIDLGTTNSVLARAVADGIEIVPNTLEGESTPSAVAVTSTNEILVGQDALDKPMLVPATKFKRNMGTLNTYRMQNGQEMTPEALSAEVLKELKAGAALRYDYEPRSVVITVPAMFLQPQCEATHRAAELAGLDVVALLQEPIAAATAYLEGEPDEGHYLVYDLGGGTFDVSLVRVRDREMSVVAHGGDNYLGGADFDLKIYEWVMGQLVRSQGALPQLETSPYREMLIRACEQTRIRLSSKDNVSIDLSDFDLPVKQLPLTRAQLEDLIQELIDRTIRLTRERLENASLQPHDIARLLLVGGPTRMPSLRKRLDNEFGIPRSHDLNPMTVVARGAAIHASGILREDRATTKVSYSQREAQLELFYDPVAQEREQTVSGRVISPVDFAGEVRIARASGDWDTGWISLRKGAFVCQVMSGRSTATEFVISLRDVTGAIWIVTPQVVVMRYGIVPAHAVTPYTYGVALENGSFGEIIKLGIPLPAHGSALYSVIRNVAAGSNDELIVYFLEGTSNVAKENTKVGELRIRGVDLPRSVKEGEKVEIRIHMDESRRLKMRVYLPVYDLEFVCEAASLIDKPDAKDLTASLVELETTLDDLGQSVGSEDMDVILRVESEKEKLEADTARIERGEIGEAERVAKKLADIKADVRKLSGRYGTAAEYRKTIEMIDDAEKIASDFEDRLGVATTEDLRREADKCLRLDDTQGMQAVRKRASEIFWRHYRETEACWSGFIDELRENRHMATNSIRYHDCLSRAEDCLMRRDLEGVRTFVVKAWEFLPDSEIQRDRFHDTTIG